MTVKYEIKNTGRTEVNGFIHLLSETERRRLAYMTASESKKESRLPVNEAEEVPAETKGSGFVAYKVSCFVLVARWCLELQSCVS